MHYFVKLLVEADSAEEALAQAEADAERLVEYGEFDWFQLNGRWGDAEAFKADSDEGKKLIKEGMDASRADFDSAMKSVRYMMENFSDEDIFEENFGDKKELPEGVYSLSKWQFGQVYKSHTSAVYSEGEVVENQRSLDAQFKYSTNPLWVVGVDFHY